MPFYFPDVILLQVWLILSTGKLNNWKKSVTHQRCKSRVANMWMDNVTLTFDLQTSISIGFLLSPSVKVTTSKNRTKIWYFFHFRTISSERNVGSKWNLVHTCLMVRGGSLSILRFVGQRSRSHCPSTCFIINTLPPLTIRHMCTKFHLDPTFCS
jgi:hypothetical protein